jgi:hypothetical protein
VSRCEMCGAAIPPWGMALHAVRSSPVRTTRKLSELQTATVCSLECAADFRRREQRELVSVGRPAENGSAGATKRAPRARKARTAVVVLERPPALPHPTVATLVPPVPLPIDASDPWFFARSIRRGCLRTPEGHVGRACTPTCDLFGSDTYVFEPWW